MMTRNDKRGVKCVVVVVVVVGKIEIVDDEKNLGNC